MNGDEFLRKVKKLAKRNQVAYVFIPAKGKGSHGRAYYGSAFTTVKDRKKEIGSGLLSAMCKQLGISPGDL